MEFLFFVLLVFFSIMDFSYAFSSHNPVVIVTCTIAGVITAWCAGTLLGDM